MNDGRLLHLPLCWGASTVNRTKTDAICQITRVQGGLPLSLRFEEY